MDPNPHDRGYYGSQPQVIRSPSPVSQFDPRQGQSGAATPAPSYHSQPAQHGAPYPPDRQASSVYSYQPSAPGGPTRYDSPYQSSNLVASPPPIGQHGLPANPKPNSSPFDSVFDDNAYPMNSSSRQNLVGGSTSDISQQGYYSQQDTGYHGGHNPYEQGRPPNSADDIPLQDRAQKDSAAELGEMNDHIYDDPNGGRSRRRKKAKKIPLGGLGMFGSDKKRIPWAVYILTAAQVGVFIGEIVKNSMLTGSPIMTKPEFNYMIGPSQAVLNNMGARFVPCMRNIQGKDDFQNVPFLCPNGTALTDICYIAEVCGFSKDKINGNQWWRFIVPIFLHAGLIHIAFNMLLQMTLVREMEQAIGTIRFVLVYFSAGIFGFVMGGNFSPPAITSTGASGAIFGIIALTLLDLLYSWKERKSPVKDLMFIIVDIVISFVLGLLPGIDNFSHIGGFLMGLALGITVLHSPNALRLKIGDAVSYSTVPGTTSGPPPFLKNPVGFFKGRKPLWWAWWLVRVAALVLIIVVFIVLLNSFYTQGHSCGWCKYLSCINVNGWCDLGIIRPEDRQPS